MRVALAVVVLVAAGCAARPTRTVIEPIRQAEDGIDVYTERVLYPVEANDSAAVRAAIKADGRASIPREFQGFTRWTLNWTFNYEPSGGRCHMTKVTVDVLVRMVMPELTSGLEESAALRDKWLTYWGRLDRHERDHAENGIKCAREVKRMLEAHEAPSCGEMTKSANDATVPLIAACRARDTEYDEKTKHGVGQGIVIP